MIKKLLALSLMISFFSVITGCNTMEGVGEDMEKGGEKIQEKSRDAQD